jgi:methyl-accepting chemotaxis protein
MTTDQRKLVQQVQERLDFIELDDGTKGRLRQLGARLGPALEAGLERFYGILSAVPSLARMFKDRSVQDHARERQVQHWRHLFSAQFDADYAAAVRRVGATHARIGLEPRWYIGGYALLLESLVRELPKTNPRGLFGWRRRAEDDMAADVIALFKAAMIDLDLSISLYLEELQADRDRLSTETALLDRIKGVIAGVQSSVAQFSLSTREISEASADLSSRTENQAQSLARSLVAIEELTRGVTSVSDRAARISAMMEETGKAAEEGNQLAERMSTAIQRIAKSSDQVGETISVIDDIAFQTNLLALNAGVEAARAGEAGRGFAVVASEVRELALRSANAAKEIKALIQDSKSHVSDGLGRVKETSGALTQIAQSVQQVKGLVAEMSQDARAQTSGITEISGSIAQFEQISQQNAAMSEETAAASVMLADEARSIQTLLQGFEDEQRGQTPPPLRKAG